MLRLSPELKLSRPWYPAKHAAARGRCCRARSARRSVLVFLAIVLGFHAALLLAAGLSTRFRDPEYGDKAAKLRRCGGTERGSRLILALGSSRTGLGMDGLGIGRELGDGTVAFNFGIPGGGPIRQNLYLNRLMREGAKPDLLLLELLPVQFRLTGEHPSFRPFMMDRGECGELSRFGYPKEESRREWLETRCFPLSRLGTPLLGRIAPNFLPAGSRYNWSRDSDSHGWNPTPFTSDDETIRLARGSGIRAEHGPVLRELVPSGGPLLAFEETLALCSASGIPTHIVWMPEASDYRTLYSPEVLGRFRELLAKWRVEYGIQCIDAREWMPDNAFIDAHHLSQLGARTFSMRLAGKLAESGPRAKDGIE